MRESVKPDYLICLLAWLIRTVDVRALGAGIAAASGCANLQQSPQLILQVRRIVPHAGRARGGADYRVAGADGHDGCSSNDSSQSRYEGDRLGLNNRYVRRTGIARASLAHPSVQPALVERIPRQRRCGRRPPPAKGVVPFWRTAHGVLRDKTCSEDVDSIPSTPWRGKPFTVATEPCSRMWSARWRSV
jgi:hypothetical protein